MFVRLFLFMLLFYVFFLVFFLFLVGGNWFFVLVFYWYFGYGGGVCYLCKWCYLCIVFFVGRGGRGDNAMIFVGCLVSCYFGVCRGGGNFFVWETGDLFLGEKGIGEKKDFWR